MGKGREEEVSFKHTMFGKSQSKFKLPLNLFCFLSSFLLKFTSVSRPFLACSIVETNLNTRVKQVKFEGSSRFLKNIRKLTTLLQLLITVVQKHCKTWLTEQTSPNLALLHAVKLFSVTYCDIYSQTALLTSLSRKVGR